MTTKDAMLKRKCRCQTCKFSKLLCYIGFIEEYAPYFCLKDRRMNFLNDEMIEAIKYVWLNYKITKENVAAVSCYALNLYELLDIKSDLGEEICFNDIVDNTVICLEHSHPARKQEIEFYYIERSDDFDVLYKIYEEEVIKEKYFEIVTKEEGINLDIPIITNIFDYFAILFINGDLDNYEFLFEFKYISIDLDKIQRYGYRINELILIIMRFCAWIFQSYLMTWSRIMRSDENKYRKKVKIKIIENNNQMILL